MKSFIAREFGSSLWFNWITSFVLVCAAILFSNLGYKADLTLIVDHVPVPEFLIKSDFYLYSLSITALVLAFAGLMISGQHAFWKDQSLKWAIVFIDKLLFIFNIYGIFILIDSINKGIYTVSDMVFVIFMFMFFFIGLRGVEFWRWSRRAIAMPLS